MDWGVLKDTEQKGVYQAGTLVLIDDDRLIARLAEAFLLSRGGDPFPLKALLKSPSFFLFQIKPIHAKNIVTLSDRLEMLRHGLDDDLLMLK